MEVTYRQPPELTGSYHPRFASTVTASGSVLTSDARWKTNVANVTGGLDAVLALRPVRYD